jgi:nucleotide-binding universal stress UspA family protein
MYRSILVPLDGSTAAEHALPVALSLARRLGAALRIVHVHITAWGVYGEGGLYGALVDQEVRDGMQAYLNETVQRISTAAEVSLTSTFLEGLVPDAIKRHAADANVDLIVMTTHGRGPMARFWLGSVSDALVRQMSIPVLFVPPNDIRVDLSQEPVIKRIVISLDGSQLAEQVLEPAMALATAAEADVVLLRVIQQWTPDHDSPDAPRMSGLRPELLKQMQEADQQEQAAAEKYLAQLVEKLRAPSMNVQSRLVRHGQPATAILEEASTLAVDIIALATHGHGGLKRLLLGSVADKVLRGATTPVLVYRPVAESTAADT